MALQTLRRVLNRLQEANELQTVSAPVSSDLKAAAVVARSCELGGPAVHFTSVDGANKASLLGGLMAGPGLLYYRERKPWTRLALLMGIDPKCTYEEFLFTLFDRANNASVKPIAVAQGDCQEVVLSGSQADVTRFPFPKVHPGDGGRYGFGTVIIRDPDTGREYWQTTRFMIHGPGRLSLPIQDGSPLAAIAAKYANQKQAMPYALAIGPAPVITLAGLMELPAGSDVASAAGSLGMEPVLLVRATRSDLLIPGDAELVIEGAAPAGETTVEGPYPNFAGFQPAGKGQLLTVTAITHRPHPIIPFWVEAAKGGDAMNVASLVNAAKLYMDCKNTALPVRWVALPTEMRLGMCVVATKVPYNGFVFALTGLLFGNSDWYDKVLVVDYDTNPEELGIAINDMINKANPNKSWLRSDEVAAVSRMAKYPTENGYTSTLYVNATWDPTWKKEWIGIKIAFESCYPREVQQRVLERWHRDLGFTKEPMVFQRVGA